METDIRVDYAASDFSPEGKLVSPMHPIEFDEALGMLGNEPLVKVAERLALPVPSPGETFVLEWPAVNLKLDCEFVDVRVSTTDEPARKVCVNGPSYGGYDPVGMFERLMKPIIVKAKKRQAGERGDYTRVLVCDVSDTVIAAHLREEPRIDGCVEILERELQPRVKCDYDVIVLCQRRGWGRELQLAYSVCANGKYHATIAALFGSTKILRSTP